MQVDEYMSTSWPLKVPHVHYFSADMISWVFLLCSDLYAAAKNHTSAEWLSIAQWKLENHNRRYTCSAHESAVVCLQMASSGPLVPLPVYTSITCCMTIKLLQHTHTHTQVMINTTTAWRDKNTFNCKYNHWRLWHLCHVVPIVVSHLFFSPSIQKRKPRKPSIHMRWVPGFTCRMARNLHMTPSSGECSRSRLYKWAKLNLGLMIDTKVWLQCNEGAQKKKEEK